MEVLNKMLWELVIAAIGILLSYLFTRLGSLAGRLWQRKADDEAIQSIAKTCVQAVEQMYGGVKGEEKLEIALKMCESFAAEKGIPLEKGEMRIFIESALAGLKGAFLREADEK